MSASAAFLGIPYQVSPQLEDGKVLQLGQDGPIVIGTHKLSEHREEARRIVREGLADVLAWLGEPIHPATGEQVLASIKALAEPVKWVGRETRTDEDWARRKATAEKLAPLHAQDVAAWTATLDRLITEAATSPSHVWAATRYDPATADPIGDIKAAMKAFKSG